MSCVFICLGSEAQQPDTFDFTGLTQTYTVPECVNYLDVDVRGAEGAAAAAGGASPGGRGGRVQARIGVTPNESLNILVGGQGVAASGGFNGGGSGGSSGGGGGGASDIRRGGTDLTDRIVIAGGGGGGAYQISAGSLGGHGGGLSGEDGWRNVGGQGSPGTGRGGTQTQGGSGGDEGAPGTDGSLGEGGIGGTSFGGGGGGGYYGGGGGSAPAAFGCGGGGGSGYTTSSAVDVVHTHGFQSGDGQIIIIPVPDVVSSPIVIKGDTTGCIGTTTSYTVDPVPEATAYNWSFPAGINIDEGQGTDSVVVTYSAISSGTIEVTASNDCDTSVPATLDLTVVDPTIDAGADTMICVGDSVQLNPGGPTQGIYVWSPAAGLSDSTAANPWASPANTTTYTATVTYNEMCMDTDDVEVVVLLVVDAGNDAGICAGDSIQLQAVGGESYAWSPATGLSDPAIANPWARPSDTTTYTVTVTDSSGCTATDAVTVFVTNRVADAGPDRSVCEGDSVQLTASGGDSYLWSPPTGLSDPAVPDPWAASPEEAITYTVAVTGSNGCTATDSATVTPLPHPVAGFDFDITDHTVNFINASTYADSHDWDFGDDNTDTKADTEHTYEAPGFYEVCLTVSNACESDMHCETIVISSVPHLAGQAKMKVYPNPAGAHLTVAITGIAASEMFELQLFSMEGKQMEPHTAINRGHQQVRAHMNVSNLSEGFYLLRVTGDRYIFNKKIYVTE